MLFRSPSAVSAVDEDLPVKDAWTDRRDDRLPCAGGPLGDPFLALLVLEIPKSRFDEVLEDGRVGSFDEDLDLRRIGVGFPDSREELLADEIGNLQGGGSELRNAPG